MNLLSCPVPWCGAPARETYQADIDYFWYVTCTTCGCSTEGHPYPAEAEHQWNTLANRVYQPVAFDTLTPSQCRAILSAKTRWDGSLELPLFRDGGKLVQSLIECGMAVATTKTIILSPAGLEARARLINED